MGQNVVIIAVLENSENSENIAQKFFVERVWGLSGTRLVRVFLIAQNSISLMVCYKMAFGIHTLSEVSSSRHRWFTFREIFYRPKKKN